MDIAKKHQTPSLQLKLTLFTTSIILSFFICFIFLVYTLGTNVLRNVSIERNREMARILAASVDSVFEKEAELIKIKANSQFLVDGLKESNLKYRSMSEAEVRRYLLDMDKRWIEAPSDHPLLKEYLENKISLRLRQIKAEENKTASIMVSDKFGGLAGATSRPSGFYVSDRSWWKDSYADGEIKVFTGNVEYNEANNLWCLPFAVPIKDESGAGLLGIYKVMVDITIFFKPLYNFKIGATGSAALVDNKSYLLYQNNTEPFANKFCEYAELKKTIQNEDRWGVLSSVYLYQGETLAAYSKVEYPFAGKGIDWFVFVNQSLKEIFSPLNKLIFQMVIHGSALISILALLIFIFNSQNLPVYSLVQAIKDTSAKKNEGKDFGNIERRDKPFFGKE